jgi:hypothetical protein
MSTKTDFTPEQWDTIVKTPLMVGWAIVAASPSGPVGMMKEMSAMARVVMDSGKQAAEGSLVRAITDEIKLRAFDKEEGAEKLAVSDVKPRALKLCRDAIAAISGKDQPGEAEAFRIWLMSVANAVAEASKEGGFLGFGGTRVSEDEQAALKELAATLDVKA